MSESWSIVIPYLMFSK